MSTKTHFYIKKYDYFFIVSDVIPHLFLLYRCTGIPDNLIGEAKGPQPGSHIPLLPD